MRRRDLDGYARDAASGLLLPRGAGRGPDRGLRRLERPRFMTTGPAFFGGSIGYAQQVISDAPVRYYRMLETTGTTAIDAMGAGNGTYSGGFTLAQGAFVSDGSSVLFNAGASPSGTINTGLSTNYTSAITVEFFFNASATGQSASPTLVGKRQYYANSQADFPIIVLWVPSTKQVQLNLSDGTSYSVFLTLNSSTLNAGTDYHCAAIYRAAGLCEIYINGASVASSSITSTISGTTSIPWTIARASENGAGSGNSGFNGRIGEVAIYNKALSGARIAAHYAARI